MQYSIINFSTVLKHKDKRIDSGHYHPYHLNNLRKYQAHSKPLGSYILHMSGGATPLGAIYPDTGIPFLRVQNIMQNYLSEPNMAYLTESQHNAISRSKLRTNDVLLTITGVSYGKSAVVTSKFNGSNINQHSVKMTVTGISPHFLATFLNCKYGYSQSSRHVVGDTRPALDYTAISNFFIPNLTDSFQNKIEAICLEVELKNKTRDSFYNQAENILLSELGLADWQPKRPIGFIKRYSDIKESERMDADYFQPKYEEIVNAIKRYSDDCDTLENLVSIKKCIEVGSDMYLDEGVPFIRVSNLSPFEITKEKHIAEKLYMKIKEHQPKKDEILFSKDATPGIAYHLNENPKKMIPSGGILRLQNTTNRINNEYLTLVLNSILTKEQVDRDVGGSIILHWRPDQVKETLIPILSKKIQTKIQKKIIESLSLRKQSKYLLECAKRAVEIAIEKDEKTAIAWLKKATKE